MRYWKNDAKSPSPKTAPNLPYVQRAGEGHESRGLRVWLETVLDMQGCWFCRISGSAVVKMKKKAALVNNESGYCLTVKVEENETGGLIITIKRCEECSNDSSV